MAYPSFEPSSEPSVPPARPGHRRRFSDADRCHILAEAARPGASVSEAASPVFVDVEIVDGSDADREVTP
jgi:hypothetical protein